MLRPAVALTSIIVAFPCLTQAVCAQVGYDRRGGDYLNFTVRSGDPAVCAARCDRDQRCRAWSFNYPSAEHAATCWLKNQVPPRVEDNASASGVRGAGVIEPRRANRESGIDRPGGDYRDFDLAPNPIGEDCKSACDSETQCRAWTYVRPGYNGPAARCYLKDRVLPPHRKACCISGVVR